MYYLPMGGYLRAVKIVFGIIAVLSALAAVSEVLSWRVYSRLAAGDEVSSSQMDVNDIREGVVGLLELLGLVAGVIVFILWLYRAYQNTDQIAPGTRRYGRGWAIGGWFVPIMAFWRPKQVVNDVWRAGGHPEEPSTLLAIWWTAWVVGNVFSNFIARMSVADGDMEGLRDGALAWAISDVVFAVAAVLAIKVASEITRRLDERAKNGPPQQRFQRDEEWCPAVPPKFGSGQPYQPAAR